MTKSKEKIVSKKNLAILTFLVIILSPNLAMADKGGNNGLHEGQEMQQNWQQVLPEPRIEIERPPNVFQQQPQQIRRDFQQQPQQAKRQLKKEIQNVKKEIK